MIRQQPGCTLVELVISLGIITILAPLVVTRYCKAAQRASLYTSLARSAPLMQSVREYFIKNSKFPDSKGPSGLLSASSYSNSHVRASLVSSDPEPGTISMADKPDQAKSEADTLLLILSISDSGVRWRYTSFTLPGSLLPVNY